MTVYLEEHNPLLCKEWDYTKNNGLTPNMMTYGSKKKVWWLCHLGHSYDASIQHRNLRGQGCPYCSNRRLLSGYNDLQTVYPRVSKDWHPTKNDYVKPYEVLYGCNDYAWW